MAFKDDEERRAYFREYNKGWYQRHRERLLEKRRQHNEELRKWLRRYKSKLRCVICGENHPAILQFHHRDKANKSFTIADVVRRATSLKQITNEIKKCDVLCVNCHAKRHWREMHKSDSWEEILPEE
jgi:hypothetical protein